MNKAFLMTSLVTGLLLTSAAQADLKCAPKSKQVYACVATQEGQMIDEAILCKNKKSQYELTVSGGGEAAPTMLVKQTIRTGATTYAGSEEGVSLTLSLLGGTPVKDESSAFYRNARVKLVIDDMSTNVKLKCYVNALNNH